MPRRRPCSTRLCERPGPTGAIARTSRGNRLKKSRLHGRAATAARPSALAVRQRANSSTPDSGSDRPVALDRHTAPGTDLGVIIPQRHVLNAAIVPERDRVGPPAKPHLEFRPGAVLEQIVQDGPTLLFGKPVDIGGKSLIDEQRLAPTHGMGAYDGTRRLRKDLAAIVAAHQHIGRTIDVFAR